MRSLFRLLFLILLVGSASFASADQVIVATQQKLKRLGYYDGVVDGQMGSQTAAAIRRYQLAENLKVTGTLTQQTASSLGINATAPVANNRPAPTPVPEYVAIADIFKGGPFISVGPQMQIAAIQQAQKNLKLLGYYNGPVNGKPTDALVRSLKAWQSSAGFRQTGRFDENTLKGLDLMPN